MSFGPGHCCITKITLNQARVPARFQSCDPLNTSDDLLVKVYTTEFILEGQKDGI